MTIEKQLAALTDRIDRLEYLNDINITDVYDELGKVVGKTYRLKSTYDHFLRLDNSKEVRK